MPFNQELPEWNAVGTKPPQSKLDSGWQIGERPPSGWWNWALNRTYLAIQELQNEAINADQKGVANGLATLDASGKVPASQLNVSAPADASTTTKGVVQLSNSTTSTSEALAATPKAVKDVKDEIDLHEANTSNPHSVTKAQVGLGSVENYAVATQAEAQAGTVTNKYMTPQRTKQAIDSQTGDRSTLNTSNKTTLVAAINELFTSVSDGKTQIATAITGKGVSASGGDTFPTLATKIGQISSEVTGETVVKMQTPVALLKGERVQYTSSVGSKLTNPGTLPTGASFGTAYSPDGVYLVIAHVTSPFLTIYKRSGDTFTKLANPASLPTGNGQDVAWSPDGTYLAVAHNTSPFLTIYKRSGDIFTKLANPNALPTNRGLGVAWSPDGVHLSLIYADSPYLIVYKRSGDTFTQLASVPTPTSVEYPLGVAYSPNGAYMAIAHQNNARVTIYKRIGDTFTKLGNPDTSPTGTGNSVAFSPDSRYLVVAHDTSPFVTIYKRSGDVFTKLANPTSLPSNSGKGVAWSPYGKVFALAHANSPYVSFYQQSGDTFTKLANPSSLPPTDGNSVTFSPYDTHVTVTSNTSPYLSTYKINGGLEVSDGVTLSNYLLGYTKTSANAGYTVDVAILFK